MVFRTLYSMFYKTVEYVNFILIGMSIVLCVLFWEIHPAAFIGFSTSALMFITLFLLPTPEYVRQRKILPPMASPLTRLSTSNSKQSCCDCDCDCHESSA